MNPEKHFCRNVSDHEASLSNIFRELKTADQLLDVTLVTSEGQIKAHKIVLSACSPFFQSVLFNNPHQSPMIYLKGVSHSSMEKLVLFMYEGEVSIQQEELASFLEIAKDLKVKGLSQNTSDEAIRPSKRHRMDSNHGNNQESSPNLNMIFYSNPIVKSEPNNPTLPHTNVYMNHPNVKLEQITVEPDISTPINQPIMTAQSGTEQGAASEHYQAGGTQMTEWSETLAIQSQVDNQNMLKLKPPSDLLNQAKILENKSLGLWMCSACTFTHPVLTTMQNHIQTQHF